MTYGFEIPNISISNYDIPLPKILGNHRYSHILIRQKNDNAGPHILCTLLGMDNMCN